MPVVFGEHTTDSTVTLENGMYEAEIASMTIVMDKDKPKLNDSGKQQCDVWFAIDAETRVKRRYAIGFGQNTANGAWAAFAKVLEAATGVVCGDRAQRELSDADVVGKKLRIVVETNARGYADVTNVMAAPKPNGAAAAKPGPRPIAQESADEDLPDIPF